MRHLKPRCTVKRHWDRPQLQRYAHRGEEQDGVETLFQKGVLGLR